MSAAGGWASRGRAVMRDGVALAGIALDRFAPPPPGLVVLAYHQVGAPRSGSVNLPVALFDEQMAHLATALDAGTVVTLDRGIEALAGEARPLLVAVTFDDGTADFVDHALPVLTRHAIPVTLYLATGFVDEARSFWDDGTVLDWDGVREACSTGLVDIGSHTHSHALLDRTAPNEVIDELDRSIELIGERLGVEARHFAYPKALAPSAAADRAVRERFVSAARAGGRVNPFGRTDPHALARTPVVVRDGMKGFVRKVRGGLRLEGQAREVLDRRRYAHRTT